MVGTIECEIRVLLLRNINVSTYMFDIVLGKQGGEVCYIPLQTERRGMDIPSTFSEAQPRRMYEEYSMPL